MKSKCTAGKVADNLFVGDNASYLSSECDEITLKDDECINDITTFYTGGFVAGFGYNTTLNNSGVVSHWQSLGYSTW